MPIRTITDKHYKGVSELYRKSDGKVTGYYVTYRDADGKPIKKRVDAQTRDEALLKLMEIKHQVDLDKKGTNMGATLPQPDKKILSEENKKKQFSVTSLRGTMQDHQKKISMYNDIAIVSLIDIVAFDDINILYGYETGTHIVSEMKTMIEDTLQEMETKGVFRKQGVELFSYELYHVYADKLCLFIKHDLNHRLLEFVVKQLSENIAKHKFIISDESHIHLNTTFGATKADSSVSLLYAEKALQEAKKSRKGYIFYDSYSIQKNGHIVNKVYETLIHNIKQETVTPYFQGIFDAGDNSVPCKYESLMRLMDSDGHILSPAAFMEKSKEYRLYTQLMSQMIEKVFHVMDEHDVAMTLNLSYLDINNSELCHTLMHQIKKMKIGGRLTVEIVESEQIEDLEQVNEFIFALKKQGVLIAIDDFGSGFSNFDNIVNLDIDYVKLDGSLVSKIDDEKYRVILENMVKICHDLGIKTIAEYISDESIMRLAKSIGVDYLQGYHLHKPEHWESVTATFGSKGENIA
ncbi:EAL domain-containing protein [Sulfurovum sp. XGS-02]|uniref:EAL domain-containing protein n=1 Tax=Sulfurovum sp. XGS-02 TaxID=2925411 RepID=UPI00205DB912|nr:EAL domain-containing protein [Sulfurovum sp. XGS-02]UPT78588.1 EAL domain-containing protein [Sulfurovum sp. XGS-02]